MLQNISNILKSAAQKGLWVILQNAHLALDSLKIVEKLISQLSNCKDSFRLWIITEHSNKFPSILLRMSIKSMFLIKLKNYQISKLFN